jgi:transcriptional regulator with XRE-family HTH domain
MNSQLWYEWVREIRKSNNYYLGIVAAALNIRQPTYSKIERGQRRFSPKELAAWSELMGHPVPPMVIPVMGAVDVARKEAMDLQSSNHVKPRVSRKPEPVHVVGPNRRANLILLAKNILASPRLTVQEVEALVNRLKQDAQLLITSSTEIFP